MRLYLVHCGYYDAEICDGLYEGHVNFFVVATSFEEARLKAKSIPEFQKKRMHVDGLQEINMIQGHRLELVKDEQAGDQSIIVNHKHRDLAPPNK